MLRRRIWRLPLAKMLQMTLALAGFVVVVLVRIEPKSNAAIFTNGALFV